MHYDLGYLDARPAGWSLSKTRLVQKCYPCPRNGPGRVDAGEWTRTTDLSITNALLCQLSYPGMLILSLTRILTH